VILSLAIHSEGTAMTEKNSDRLPAYLVHTLGRAIHGCDGVNLDPDLCTPDPGF
jgi:hypothetical protein